MTGSRVEEHAVSYTIEGKDGRSVARRRLLESNVLPVYHWVPPTGERNFGDELAPLVVQRLLESKGLGHITVVQADKGRTKLLAIGSIIHKAEDGDVIWGSGVNGKSWPRNLERGIRLDVRLVRGPLTRQALMRAGYECPEIYGDPGHLFPILFEKEIAEYVPSVESDARIVYVPNLNDDRFMDQDNYKALKHVQYVSPLRPPWEVARLIADAELVISSSLHGLIFADHYRVPAVPLLSMFEPIYKYIDYFEGTGRSGIRMAHSLEDALDCPEVPPAKVDCEAMVEAFPFDVVTESAAY